MIGHTNKGKITYPISRAALEFRLVIVKQTNGDQPSLKRKAACTLASHGREQRDSSSFTHFFPQASTSPIHPVASRHELDQLENNLLVYFPWLPLLCGNTNIDSVSVKCEKRLMTSMPLYFQSFWAPHCEPQVVALISPKLWTYLFFFLLGHLCSLRGPAHCPSAHFPICYHCSLCKFKYLLLSVLFFSFSYYTFLKIKHWDFIITFFLFVKSFLDSVACRDLHHSQLFFLHCGWCCISLRRRAGPLWLFRFYTSKIKIFLLWPFSLILEAFGFAEIL